ELSIHGSLVLLQKPVSTKPACVHRAKSEEGDYACDAGVEESGTSRMALTALVRPAGEKGFGSSCASLRSFGVTTSAAYPEISSTRIPGRMARSRSASS